jgi:putative ABC transport system permease protein
MRPDFRDLDSLSRPQVDAWIPLGLSEQLAGNRLDNRSARVLWGIARLKPGASLAAAKAESAVIAERLAGTHPDTEKGFGLFVAPLRDHFFRDLYGPVSLLLVGSGFVLLIGCANVSGLLLARASGRRREMAVRAALGATRARLVRQLLVEYLLLSTVAAAAGLLLAVWAIAALNGWDALRLPAFVQIKLDGLALAVSLLLSLSTGLIFGLAPAWSSARADLREVLSQAGRRQAETFRRDGGRRLLVAAEIGLALVLLVGAGLTLRSVQTLLDTGVGFRTENLLTVRMDLNGAGYAQPEARVRFAKSLLEKAETLPDVESATLWGPAPLGRATWIMFVAPEGQPVNGQEDLTMTWRHSTNPGGLDNLGLPLLKGRDFTWQDTGATTAVAVVSESVAARFWPGEEAVGKRLVRQAATGFEALTVVGVAADAKHRQRYNPEAGASWAFQPQLDIYLPYAQRPNQLLVVALRTRGAGSDVLPAFRQSVLSLDPNMTVYDVGTVEERLDEQSGTLSAVATLMTVYSAVALFLAALGIYGVLAQTVAQRTHEIGIRMALGAQARDILRLVVGQGMWMTLSGVGVGLLAALALSRLLASLLFGVTATDPLTFAAAPLVLAAVALLASYLPARRATKVDPMVALRHE